METVLVFAGLTVTNWDFGKYPSSRYVIVFSTFAFTVCGFDGSILRPFRKSSPLLGSSAKRSLADNRFRR